MFSKCLEHEPVHKLCSILFRSSETLYEKKKTSQLLFNIAPYPFFLDWKPKSNSKLI